MTAKKRKGPKRKPSKRTSKPKPRKAARSRARKARRPQTVRAVRRDIDAAVIFDLVCPVENRLATFDDLETCMTAAAAHNAAHQGQVPEHAADCFARHPPPPASKER